MLLLNGGRLQEVAAGRRLPLMMMMLMGEEKEGKDLELGAATAYILEGLSQPARGLFQCGTVPGTKAGWA